MSMLEHKTVSSVDELNAFLSKQWGYGRNLVVGWSLMRVGLKLLMAPRSRIFHVATSFMDGASGRPFTRGATSCKAAENAFAHLFANMIVFYIAASLAGP